MPELRAKFYSEVKAQLIDEERPVMYSPEQFLFPNLTWWRTWEYFENIVPKDNIEGFND